MFRETFSLGNDFPPVSYEDWRAVAEKDLAGAPFDKKLVTHTYEGVDVQPVYTERDAPDRGELPGFPPFTRGSQPLGAALGGWDLRQQYAHPDLETANRDILQDLAGGSRSLLLQLDLAARNGADPGDAGNLAGEDGLMAYRMRDFDRLLHAVHLEMVGVQLQAGAAFLPAAAALVALWRERGVSDEQACGAFAADPLAALAAEGSLPVGTDRALAMLAELAMWTAGRYPQVTAVGVDTSVYHDAGATAAQDIAFAVATGTDYLRAMTAAGLGIDEAAGQILFSFCLGTHHFLAIAKLRAARRLWARVVKVSGGSPRSGAMRIHARTSHRVLTRRDPYVNLLRNTVAMFAAGVGGAEAVTSVPLDILHGHPDTFSRRVARNSVLILQEEGNLHRVVDPTGGSWFIEKLTDQVAEKAWGVFQEIEQRGGMTVALQAGWIAEQIDSAFAPRVKDIARRKEGITGVSEFPNLAEEPVERPVPDLARLREEASKRLVSAGNNGQRPAATATFDDVVAAAAAGATIGQMAAALDFRAGAMTMPPIEAHSFAESFEELRDASDVWQQAHGRRPKVFLVPMGPVAHHTARVTYSKNFFEAGGFEVIVGDGFNDPAAAVANFSESGASIAVICSSDKLYPEIVPQLATELKAAGVRTVVLAGNPQDNEQAWRAAGVDRFIFIKCDVHATLRELLIKEGVLVP